MRQLLKTSPAARFNRGSWAVLLVALAYIACAFLYVLLAFQQPTDGWLYDTSGIGDIPMARAPLVDPPGPLRPGDELLAIEGTPVAIDALRPLPPPPNWKIGATARYTIQRAGQRLDLDVSLRARPFSALIRYYRLSGNFWLTSILWYLIGFGVFFLRPRETASRLLLLFTTYWTTVGTIVYAADSSANYFYPPGLFWWNYLLNLLWSFMFAMMVHFVLAFPVKKWPLTRRPRLALTLLYGLPAMGLALTLTTARFEYYLATLVPIQLTLIIALLAATVHNLRTVHDPVPRAQIGWVALGISAPIVAMLIGVILSLIFPEWISRTNDRIFSLMSILLPLCFGIAITRYRLFDINVIIRRTLVYGALTLTLALIYFGGVTLLQTLFTAISNQKSEISNVISTLLIAALFTPLRRHIQNDIDRRFYRKKYDAEKTVAAFGAGLRQEVDLDELSGRLLAVVEETIQPEHTSLWLRGDKKE